MINLNNKTWQYSILFLLGLTWGSSFILMKLGLQAYTPIEVALIRISASFLFLFPFLIHLYRTIPKSKWVWLTLAGLLGNGIPAFMFALGMSKINSSMGGIINSTTPLFTLIVGSLFFSLTYHRNAIVGIFLGLIGAVYLIVFAKTNSGGSTDYLYGFFPLVGSVCYGFSSNIIKFKLQEIKPIMVTGGALTFIGPLCILLVFITGVHEKFFLSPLHTESLIYIIILGVVGTSIAVLIFNYLIKHTSILFAASVTYIIPVFSVIIGLFFGEKLSLHFFIGMAIVIIGVFLTNKK